jgi:large subunit ribosomal protein L3
MAFRTGVLGQKLGMTQIFTDRGDRASVTAILAGPCLVVDKLTPEKNGYAAVRLGFAEKPLRVSKRPEIGLFKKAGLAPQRFFREVRVEPADLEKYEVGKPVQLSSIFKAMTFVDVIGKSKGKGYQGVMKLHHMGGKPNSHGCHEFFRHGGSIGCRLTPGRVHRGKRMSAHMGDVKRTVQNLVLLEIDDAQNLLIVRGSVPGMKNGYVIVKNAMKRAGQTYKARADREQQEKSKNPMKASKAGAGSAKPAGKPSAAAKK